MDCEIKRPSSYRWNASPVFNIKKAVSVSVSALKKKEYEKKSTQKKNNTKRKQCRHKWQRATSWKTFREVDQLLQMISQFSPFKLNPLSIV
jgi:hypothetical protein